MLIILKKYTLVCIQTISIIFFVIILFTQYLRFPTHSFNVKYYEYKNLRRYINRLRYIKRITFDKFLNCVRYYMRKN